MTGRSPFTGWSAIRVSRRGRHHRPVGAQQRLAYPLFKGMPGGCCAPTGDRAMPIPSRRGRYHRPVGAQQRLACLLSIGVRGGCCAPTLVTGGCPFPGWSMTERSPSTERTIPAHQGCYRLTRGRKTPSGPAAMLVGTVTAGASTPVGGSRIGASAARR